MMEKARRRGKQAPDVDRKLADIKALLLGQVKLGDGRPATEVALPIASALLVSTSGSLLIAERALGRVRAVAPDGLLTTFADLYRGTRTKRNFLNARGMAEGPDGSVYIGAGHQLDRIARDGTVTHVGGNGASGRAVLGGKALELPLTPERIAVAPNQTVYFIDSGGGGNSQNPRRVVGIGADGLAVDLAVPPPLAGYVHSAVAVGPDEALYVSSPSLTAARVLARKPGGAWGLLAEHPLGVVPGIFGDLVVAPDGTLYVADIDQARIFGLTPAGDWRVYAGASDFVSRSGDLTAIALNRPYGTTNLVAGISTDDDNQVATVAAAFGPPPVSAPAREVALFGPSGLAFGPGGDLYLAETLGWRIRRISGPTTDAPVLHAYAGRSLGELVTEYAGSQGLAVLLDIKVPVTELAIAAPAGLAFDAAGNLYVSIVGTRHASATDNAFYLDNLDNTAAPTVDAAVMRLGLDGRRVIVAGPPASLLGDVSADNALVLPAGLAFDSQGRLAIADAGSNLLHIIPAGALPP